jgi:hypothetical protein
MIFLVRLAGLSLPRSTSRPLLQWSMRSFSAGPSCQQRRNALCGAICPHALPASIPIRYRGTLASRTVIRPRAIFSRKTIAPLSSRPIKCGVFLPVSMPMVCATVAASYGTWRCAPRASKPPRTLRAVRGGSTAGPSHSQTCRRALRMSVHRGRREVSGGRSKRRE